LSASPEKVKAALAAKARDEKQKPKMYRLGADLCDEMEEMKANPV
jgi:hypothetical protein